MPITMDRPPNLPTDMVPAGVDQGGVNNPAIGGDTIYIKQKTMEVMRALDDLAGMSGDRNVQAIISELQNKLMAAMMASLKGQETQGGPMPLPQSPSPQGMLVGGRGY